MPNENQSNSNPLLSAIVFLTLMGMVLWVSARLTADDPDHKPKSFCDGIDKVVYTDDAFEVLPASVNCTINPNGG